MWEKHMNNTSFLIGFTDIVVGSLFIGLSIPLMRRSVKMNHWYGVRIAKSFESEENWYKINEYGGRLLMRWSALIVLIGYVTLFVPMRPEDGILAVTLRLAPLLLLIIPLIQTLMWAGKL
jgi:uncharacterized membrane protein